MVRLSTAIKDTHLFSSGGWGQVDTKLSGKDKPRRAQSMGPKMI